MAPEVRIIHARIGVDGGEEDVAARPEDILRAIAVMIIDIEDRDPPAGLGRRLGRDRRIVEVAIAAEIVAPGMMARRATQGERRPLACQHRIERSERGLGGPIGALPGPRRDRRGGVEAVGAEPGVDPVERQRPPPHHRPGIAACIALAPCRAPILMGVPEEGEIGLAMHGAERRLAMIHRRLDSPHRRQHRLGPRRRLGIRDEAAIVQFDRRRVGELAWIKDAAHQRRSGWRSRGRTGSDSSRLIRAQRSAGAALPHSIRAATMSRPSP